MSLYKQAGSKYWWYSFVLNGQKVQRSTKVTDKKLAKKIFEHERSQFVLGKKTGELKPILLRDMLTRYVENYAKGNKRSAGRDEWVCKMFADFVGGKLATAVTPEDVERFRKHRLAMKRGDKNIAPSTVNRETTIIGAAYAKATDWNLLPWDFVNPVRRVKAFSEKGRERKRFLSREEAATLLAHCPPWLGRLVRVLLFTGCRISEVLAMTWDSINPTTNQIAIPRTKSGEPKLVEIHQEVANVINSLPRLGPFLFCDAEGKPLSRKGGIRTAFDKAVRAAGLQDVLIHDLRRTYGSWSVMAGNDLLTVSKQLGHSTARTTERVYAHLSRAHLTSAQAMIAPLAPTGMGQGQNGEAVAPIARAEFPPGRGGYRWGKRAEVA